MSQNSGLLPVFFERASGFFYDSRRAETLAFNQLKVLIFVLVNKKKEPLEKNSYFGTCKATECIIIFEF